VNPRSFKADSCRGLTSRLKTTFVLLSLALVAVQGGWRSVNAAARVPSAGSNHGQGRRPPEVRSDAAWSYLCVDEATACTGTCRPGDTKCTGKTPESCDSLGHWKKGAVCSYLCSDGQCRGECAPGAKDCVGNAPRSCGADAHWVSAPVCPILCSKGVCSGACTSGSRQCSGRTPQLCSTASQWVNEPACPFICAAGKCAGECEPGIKQCTIASPQTCDENGKWQTGEPCPYLCAAGSCVGSWTRANKRAGQLVDEPICATEE